MRISVFERERNEFIVKNLGGWLDHKLLSECLSPTSATIYNFPNY